MANSFGKYGIDDLTNFNFTSSEYTKNKKYNNIYCNIRNDKDSGGNYQDKTFKVNDGVLEYVSSNEDHINISKAQYHYYYNNDCSCGFDLYELEIKDDECLYENTNDASINYTGVELPVITPDTSELGIIYDTSLTELDLDNIDYDLMNKLPFMSFPRKIRFDNTFC
tara:strand:+ start:624 stop:1124 length:501 start_codon:yes stop_codon:yes gene_type:complete